MNETDWSITRERVGRQHNQDAEIMDRVREMTPAERDAIWKQYQTGDEATRNKLESTATAIATLRLLES